MHVVVLHGPNLNALGTREPDLYGEVTLEQLNAALAVVGQELGVSLRTSQSNHEGELIDRLYEASRNADGVILNPGAYAHTSLAIADAVRGIAPVPVVEVHLTNTSAREEPRRVALVGAACIGRVEGFGVQSYALALRALVARAN